MTRKELIYDCLMILEGGGITDESRLDEDYIGYKIDQYRAKEIRDTFNRKPVIEPIWLQDYGIFDITKVNKAEDQTVAVCDCSFGKVVLPPVVSLSDPMSNNPDLGAYSIRSSCGSYEFHYMNVTKLPLLTKDSIASKFRYFTRVFNSYYLTPVAQKARAILILEKPLDGFVLDNSYIDPADIETGVTYVVASGTVNTGSIKYTVGQTFIGNSSINYQGGKIQYYNQKRRMTNDDNYPMSYTMAEVVLMKIFTQDFGMEAKFVSDIRNDSEDQFRVLKSGQGA